MISADGRSTDNAKGAVSAVLFDLGNTLVAYYERGEFPPILERCIDSVDDFLASRGPLFLSDDLIRERTADEDREAHDFSVRPLEGRLARIFDLDEQRDSALLAGACREFLKPIFALGRVYDDAIPCLAELREMGLRTAVVSNTPWGSPAEPWVEELERLGLTAVLNDAVFCRDCGFRKPYPAVFELALERLGVHADACLFIGDDPRWDVAGAEAAGIEPFVIARSAAVRTGPHVFRSLRELLDILG